MQALKVGEKHQTDIPEGNGRVSARASSTKTRRRKPLRRIALNGEKRGSKATMRSTTNCSRSPARLNPYGASRTTNLRSDMKGGQHSTSYWFRRARAQSIRSQADEKRRIDQKWNSGIEAPDYDARWGTLSVIAPIHRNQMGPALTRHSAGAFNQSFRKTQHYYAPIRRRKQHVRRVDRARDQLG